MIAHVLNIAVGLTFSGGILDLFIFGILQGNAKTSWMRIIPVGIIYFLLYYFIFSFLIKKYDFKTPGREDDDEETKLYTKADVNARNTANSRQSETDGKQGGTDDEKSAAIARGLGGKKNITSVDCCATRLRCSIENPELVDEKLLKATGAVGVVKRGQGIQVIYGPQVTVIKSNLEAYLAQIGDEDEVDRPVEAQRSEQPVTDSQSEADSQPVTDSQPEAGVSEQMPAESVQLQTSSHILYSPLKGKAAPISESPDEAFASKAMGDGYMVMPEDGTVVAPEDGTVLFVFPSKHAIGMKAADGTEYLLHIGVDTVKLDGKGFEVFVTDGQQVHQGDKLMEFDLSFIREHAASEACMVIFTGLTSADSLNLTKEGMVDRLDAIGEIHK